MGFIKSRDTVGIWKAASPYLKDIVLQYKREGESETLGIMALSGKIKIVRSLLLWATNTEGGYQDNKHLASLKSQIEGIDTLYYLQILDEIENWSRCRNEIVHSMLNKNIVQLEEKFCPQAETGMRLARALDAKEREIKTGNNVRRKAGLSNK